MADVDISVTTMTVATRTSDLLAAGTSVNAAQTFAIAAANVTNDLIIHLEEEGSGAATVTFDAGNKPPAERQGLGSVAIVLANADFRDVVLEGARHLQANGTITGTVTTNDVYISAYRIPKTI